MNLVRTSILSFIATLVKMIAGLIINKAIALFIGPGGLAVIGQFQNVSTLIQTVAQGGINAGVTKYTAEFNAEEARIKQLWSTAIKLTVTFTTIVSIVLLISSKQISYYVFNTTDNYFIFIIFAFTLLLFTVNQLLLSILNGLKQIKTFITINIAQSVCSLLFTSLLIYLYHLEGALVALVTNQSIVFVILLWKLRNHNIISLEKFKDKWQPAQAKVLFKYSLMALVTACSLPLSQIVVRDYIANTLSWKYAGYWQAMTYISTTYLTVITVALATYYLPRLSEISDKLELKREIYNGYKLIIPFVSILAFAVYMLRDLALWLLFTPEFKPMFVLFKWQMVGDVIKIAAWLISYLMLAKAMTKTFIITEILFAISFSGLSIFFLNVFGFVGLSYAFAANYFLYFVAMIILMRKHFY
ncbi:O-antigen flippase [Mixta theicola]|uniref:O-antigen flippase n=1 Tax=Mixta theicola TaxID=1458355 RepID=A0A2K1QAW7_9GAMM|nr:O-antigen translocase [Mixta theicola]PNS12172.1 O-antigen flippase [Mixta theicola]